MADQQEARRLRLEEPLDRIRTSGRPATRLPISFCLALVHTGTHSRPGLHEVGRLPDTASSLRRVESWTVVRGALQTAVTPLPSVSQARVTATAKSPGTPRHVNHAHVHVCVRALAGPP